MTNTHATEQGAAGFRDLLAYIGDLSETTCTDLYEHGDNGDSRDYLGMSEMVAQSLQTNLNHVDPEHRQGYLRALTSLLCIVADGCAPGADWEPLRDTAPAFDAPTATAALLAKLAL